MPQQTRAWILLAIISGSGCSGAGGAKSPPERNDQAAQAQPAAAKAPEPEPEPEEPAEKLVSDPAEPPPEEPVVDRHPHPGLKDPTRAGETAPERYTAVLATTKGDVLIDVRRSWAPIGADRFYNLIKVGAFNNVAFFRVVAGFMAQVGIPGDPEIARIWRDQRIDDDPVTQSNTRGMVSFATSGKDSRVNQFFINFGDNARLDPMGFAPFGRVRDMGIVDQLHSGYGEAAPMGRGPAQARIQREGNAYLQRDFPALDYIKFARIVDEHAAPREAPPRRP